MNWKYIQTYMDKKHFFISEKEYTDIIFFRKGAAFNLLIRMYEFFTQKKVAIPKVSKSPDVEKERPHFMLPTFAKKASEEFIWAEKNHRNRKLFLLKTLEEHRIIMDKVKEEKDIRKYMKTKKLKRQNKQMIKSKVDGEYKKLSDTQTELVVLKNYNNNKHNQSEMSKVWAGVAGVIEGNIQAAVFQVFG